MTFTLSRSTFVLYLSNKRNSLHALLVFLSKFFLLNSDLVLSEENEKLFHVVVALLQCVGYNTDCTSFQCTTLYDSIEWNNYFSFLIALDQSLTALFFSFFLSLLSFFCLIISPKWFLLANTHILLTTAVLSTLSIYFSLAFIRCFCVFVSLL